MRSGPYQSKLLRLAVGQYRKGIDRHRRAVRQTRTAAVTGAVVGSAWALVPLRRVVQVSQRLRRQWKQLAASHRTKRMELSEASDADEAISQIVSSLSQWLLSQPLLKQPDEAGQQLPLELIQPVEPKELAALTLGRSRIKRWIAGLSSRLGWIHPKRGRQITGFASDIETRSIVLVLDNAIVWDGLSAEQQRTIADKVAVLMSEKGGVQLCTVPSKKNQLSNLQLSEVQLSQTQLSQTQLSQAQPTTARLGDVHRSSRDARADEIVKANAGDISRGVRKVTKVAAWYSGLAQFVRSFWVDVLWAVVQMRRRDWRSLPAGRKKLPGQPSVWKTLIGADRERLSGGVFDLTKNLLYRKPVSALEPAANSDGIEADVISIDYIEHPLERFLNWLDRRLLWVEHQVQRIVRWLQRSKKAV